MSDKINFYEIDNKIKLKDFEKGIWMARISSILILLFLFSLGMSFSLANSLKTLNIDQNTLEYSYLINWTAIIVISSFFIFYLINLFLINVIKIRVKNKLIDEKKLKSISIYLMIFNFIVPGLLIYKSNDYNSEFKFFNKKEKDFISKTSYYHVLKLDSFKSNFKKEFKNYLKVVYFLKKNTSFLKNKNKINYTKNFLFTVFLTTVLSFSLIGSFIIYDKQTYAENEYNTFQNEYKNKENLLELKIKDKELYGFVITSDQEVVIEVSFNMAEDNLVFQLAGYFYYDLNGDGLTVDGEQIYIDSDNNPTLNEKYLDSPVPNDGKKHGSTIKFYQLTNYLNSYTSFSEILVEISDNPDFENSQIYKMNESPYTKIISIPEIETLYAKVSFNNKNDTIYFETRSGNEVLKLESEYYKNYHSIEYDYNVSYKNETFEINTNLDSEFDSDFESYINQDDNKVACYRLKISYIEYDLLIDPTYYDTEFYKDIKLLTADQINSNIPKEELLKCPDYYIPFGYSHKINFKDIPANNNNFLLEHPGYIRFNVNVILIDDYTTDVIYSGYPSNDLVVNEADEFTNLSNSSIAGYNNNIKYYYDSESNLSSANGSSSYELVGQNYFGEEGDSNGNIYDSNSTNLNSMVLYDFNGDGDYSWPSDSVQTLSMFGSPSICLYVPVYHWTLSNIYNSMSLDQWEIIFFILYTIFVIIISLLIAIILKKYSHAIDSWKRVNLNLSLFLSEEAVKISYRKWLNGEEYDIEKERVKIKEDSDMRF